MKKLDLDALRDHLQMPIQEVIELPRVSSIPQAYALAMPEERSFDLWVETGNLVRSMGYVAVGIGSRDALLQLADHMADSDWLNIETEIRSAQVLDTDTWLETREQELMEDSGSLPSGDWIADETPFGGLWFPFDRGGAHLNPWWLGIIPAMTEADVPLSLAYGGWNDCPRPNVHSAMAKRWQASHGARIVATGPDTIEFIVDRPPETKQQALSLAKEHYLYCTDNVDQGAQTIGRYASKLLGAGVWSFWWD